MNCARCGSLMRTLAEIQRYASEAPDRARASASKFGANEETRSAFQLGDLRARLAIVAQDLAHHTGTCEVRS